MCMHATEPSITSVVNEEIVRVLDTRMGELGRSIERQMGKATAAAAVAAANSAVAAGGGGGGVGSSLALMGGVVPTSPEPLVMLSMSKAEAAERMASEARSGLSVG